MIMYNVIQFFNINATGSNIGSNEQVDATFA